MRLAAILFAGCALSACVKPGEMEAPAPAPEAVRVSDDAYVAPDIAEGGIVFRTGAARSASPTDAGDPAPTNDPQPEAKASAPLGKITVSLGPPSETGLWASSGLVDTARRVYLADPDAGVRIEVEMRPTQGVDQLSLEAYQALGLSPAEIVTLEVHAR